jgi:hypothetical protein
MSSDAFHDFHRERSTTPEHIRLISEGGSSLARSPGPICIDSIQVTQTCTTESQHMVYRSTSGSNNLPDNPLFSAPAEYAMELDKGLLPAVLHSRFKQQNQPLSESAYVSVHNPGRIWVITDRDRKYSIRNLQSRLTIYLIS